MRKYIFQFQFQVANLAESNLSLKLKIKFAAGGKWSSFKAKWPRTSSVLSKIYNTVKVPFTSRNRYWVGTKRVVAKTAKAGLALFTIGKCYIYVSVLFGKFQTLDLNIPKCS